MYHHGMGVKQDFAEALKWYRKAAEHGLAEAESNLGVMYEDGAGVPKDYVQAAALYQSAALHGSERGELNLATLYYTGRGVPLDYVSAYVWYTRAAATGDSLAVRLLKELKGVMTARQKQEAQSRLLDGEDARSSNDELHSPFGDALKR